MTQQISPRDYELLSAYLDGELSARDRARLEARMSKQPELRLGLEELRQTSLLLRSLPRKRAPRNFTIPNALPRRRALPRLYPALSFASALAGILFLIVFIGDYTLGTSTQSLASKVPASTSAPAIAIENQASRDLATTAAAPVVPVPDNNPPSALVPSPTQTETAAPETMSGPAVAPTETPSVEPSAEQSTGEPLQGFTSQALNGTDVGPATGMGGGAGSEANPCAENCTPEPTGTVAPTSEADTSEAWEGGQPPTIGSSAAGSASVAATPTPTPSVENIPAPDFTPDASTRNQSGAAGLTETAQTPTIVPGARETAPTETPTVEATSEQSQWKSAAGTNSTMATAESPTQDMFAFSTTAIETPTIAPTEQLTLREKLSQPYTQMIVRLAEIGLAGFALLAGLAAIFLRINSRS